jgi:tetratricopeptide (TPR) repeat protein
MLLHRKGRFSEGEKLFQKLIEQRRRHFGHDHPAVGDALTEYARCVLHNGYNDKAEILFRKALDIFPKGTDQRFTKGRRLCTSHLGAILEERGDHAEAERWLDESVRLMRKSLGPRSPKLPPVLKDLISALLHQNKYREVKSLLREFRTEAESAFGDTLVLTSQHFRKLPMGGTHHLKALAKILVVTPPGFLPGFRPAVLLEKRASEALWSHHQDS